MVFQKIYRFFSTNKKEKKLLICSLINIVLTLFLVSVYSIFKYGSPLIYEDHPESFREAKKVPLVEGTVVSQEFKAISNNLGTVGVKLSVEEKNLGYKSEGEIVEPEFLQEKETEGDFFDENHFSFEPVGIIFRIKEKDEREWFYENSYFFEQGLSSRLYPFGFPVQEKSEGKTYVVELIGKQGLQEKTPILYAFISIDENKQPYIYSRYVYSRGEIKENIRPILTNAVRRIERIFKNNISQVNLIAVFISLEIVAYSLLRKKEKEFKEKIVPLFAWIFLFFLFLFTVSTLNFVCIKKTFLKEIFSFLSIYNLPLGLSVIVFGFLSFYFNQDEIETRLKEEERLEKLAEKKRNKGFNLRFPKISRVWGLRSFVKWVYKEGWLFSFILISLLIIGFLLRIYNLGELGYSTDEGSTALYSFVINETGLPCLGDLCYTRGLPYIYFVSLFTKIFGVTEFWVRFPGVILTSLTILLIYSLIKRVTKNKKVGLTFVFLITFSDWHFMLGRYARMYGLLTLLIFLSIYFYWLTFYKRKYKLFFPLILIIIFALLTHQFAITLIFLALEPFLRKKASIYKQKLFLFFMLITVIATSLTLIKFPGRIHLDPSYISIANFQEETTNSIPWYLNNLQPPDLTYLKHLLFFFPIVSIFGFIFISFQVFFFKNKKCDGLLKTYSYFLIFTLLCFLIYKMEYKLKYLWWFLPIFYIPFSYCVYFLKKVNKNAFFLVLLVFLLNNFFGMEHILTRDYGEDETRFPTLMSAPEELYHPDDKTPVEFVKDAYEEGDVIITDYWMQNVYLYLYIRKQSDYFLSRWEPKEYLIKFPMYKLYNEDFLWKLRKGGPVLISSLRAIKEIIQNNSEENVRIWYITGADFVEREYHYISSIEVNKFFKENYSENVVYIGKDWNSKVYLID